MKISLHLPSKCTTYCELQRKLKAQHSICLVFQSDIPEINKPIILYIKSQFELEQRPSTIFDKKRKTKRKKVTTKQIRHY